MPNPISETDVLASALSCDELVECLGMMRRALGLPTTKTISDSFSTRDYETYRDLMNCYRRAEFIKSWLTAELDAAAERIHGFAVNPETRR